MRDYETLIIHLRECAKYEDADNTFWEAANAIEELLERDRWISSEEPPDNPRDVLVTAFWHENWQTLMGWFDGTWHITVNDQVREGLSVIAWREKPLPEPPKEAHNG